MRIDDDAAGESVVCVGGMDMNLLRMSFSAAIIIMVIIILRALWLYKLPKKMFLVLWSVAVLRLLIPFSFPAIFSVYSLVSQNSFIMERVGQTSLVDFLPIYSGEEKELSGLSGDKNGAGGMVGDTGSTAVGTGQGKSRENGTEGTGSRSVQEDGNRAGGKAAGNGKKETDWQPDEEDASISAIGKGYVSAWTAIWMVGMSVCALFFSIAYILCYRQFRTSIPIENDMIEEWMLSHKIKRKIAVRQSDCVSAPLAYGFFHPVILMPKGIKWDNREQLQYIFEHEFLHIRRLDAAAKLFLAVAVCVHWFNPLVWVMYVLANRDIELSCDEGVIRQFGADSRSAYALSLIHMEEMKSSLSFVGNHFSRNAAEERITAIMKLKKKSVPACILAVVLVIAVTAAFFTSAAGQETNGKPTEIVTGQEANISSETALPREQQWELMREYKKYGVSERKGILYYKNRPIRSLADKYLEETDNEYGGKTVDAIRVYTYFNEAGTIDVRTIRDNWTEKTNAIVVFRDVKDVVEVDFVPVNFILEDIPLESVNKLAENAMKEGRYGDLEKIMPFADGEVVDEIANRMVEEGQRIDGIAAYVSQDSIIELIKAAYEKWGVSFVTRLLRYVPLGELDRLADMAEEKKDYDGMEQIMKFIEEQR